MLFEIGGAAVDADEVVEGRGGEGLHRDGGRAAEVMIEFG